MQRMIKTYLVSSSRQVYCTTRKRRATHSHILEDIAEGHELVFLKRDRAGQPLKDYTAPYLKNVLTHFIRQKIKQWPKEDVIEALKKEFHQSFDLKKVS